VENVLQFIVLRNILVLFDHRLNEKILKANKGISLPIDSLLNIDKAYVRPHLVYGDYNILYLLKNLNLFSITLV